MRRILSVLGVITAVVVVGLAPAAASQPTAARTTAAPGCPDVYFLGARGSGQPLNTTSDYRNYDQFHGLGAEVFHMADVLRSSLAARGLIVKTFADNYSADSVGDFVPSRAERAALIAAVAAGGEVEAAAYYYHHNARKYLASIKEGIATAVSDAKFLYSDCPSAHLVLGGYSQGAMVMHQAELQLKTSDPTVYRRIVGTLLLGDGDRVPHTKARMFGTATGGGEGVRTWFRANNNKDVPKPGSTANICNAKDIVCDFNWHRIWKPTGAEKTGVRVHTSYSCWKHTGCSKEGKYYFDPILKHAAQWVASRISIAPRAPQIVVSPAAAEPWSDGVCGFDPGLAGTVDIEITGSGFAPGETVSLSTGWTSYGSTTADGGGKFDVIEPVGEVPSVRFETFAVQAAGGLGSRAQSSVQLDADNCYKILDDTGGNVTLQWGTNGSDPDTAASLLIDGTTPSNGGTATTDQEGSGGSTAQFTCPAVGHFSWDVQSTVDGSTSTNIDGPLRVNC